MKFGTIKFSTNSNCNILIKLKNFRIRSLMFIKIHVDIILFSNVTISFDWWNEKKTWIHNFEQSFCFGMIENVYLEIMISSYLFVHGARKIYGMRMILGFLTTSHFMEISVPQQWLWQMFCFYFVSLIAILLVVQHD